MGKQSMGREKCGPKQRMVFTFLKDCLKTNQKIPQRPMWAANPNIFIFTILVSSLLVPNS